MALLSRLMMFIDGENLVMRFQNMKSRGYVPSHMVVHEKDTYVWHPTLVSPSRADILRVTYYTYSFGDAERVAKVRDEIKTWTYSYDVEQRTRMTAFVYPKVFRKDRSERRKGVDITITVDALMHAFRDNFDIAYFVTGDGDYLPLIEEIMRNGKQVWLAALSSGLKPELPRAVDQFFDLDPMFFDFNASAEAIAAAAADNDESRARRRRRRLATTNHAPGTHS